MAEMLYPLIGDENNSEEMPAFQIPLSEDSQFRTSLFREAVFNLPVTIYINETINGYHIKNGRLQILWADDLPRGGSAELIQDLSRVLRSRDRAALTGMFEIREHVASHSFRNDGTLDDRFTLCGGVWLERGGPIEIGIRLGAGSKGKVYELVIEHAGREAQEYTALHNRKGYGMRKR